MSLKDWKTISQSDTDWLRVKKDGSEPTVEHVDEIGEYEDEEGFTTNRIENGAGEPDKKVTSSPTTTFA